MEHSRQRWKEIARHTGGGRRLQRGRWCLYIFANFSRLPEDFRQTCTLEFSSFQGYWLPEGILVLKMKNDSLNTIVQFRGITYPRQVCWLLGALATNTKPHPFRGRHCHSFNSSPSTFLVWPQAVWMALPSHLLQEIHIHEKVWGVGEQDCRTAG